MALLDWGSSKALTYFPLLMFLQQLMQSMKKPPEFNRGYFQFQVIIP